MPQVPPELFLFKVSEIARICAISLKTAQRWRAGQSVPPATALMILRRDLGIFDKAWAGWSIRGETIFSPEGWEATQGDVRSLPLLRSAISAYRIENRNLKESLAFVEFIDEQPLPHEISSEILAQIK